VGQAGWILAAPVQPLVMPTVGQFENQNKAEMTDEYV
jgi:hypothetical protein